MCFNTAGAMRGFGRERDARWRQGAGGSRARASADWRSPDAPLDFGNSGTGSRLVMGAMATTPITAIFTGDASLRSRPMARVLEPLTPFGATL